LSLNYSIYTHKKIDFLNNLYVWNRNAYTTSTQHQINILKMAAKVTETTVQSFHSKFYITKADVGMVIGAKGRTINGIKRTHNVDVRIMESDRTDGKQFFMITGSDRVKVDAAYQNIDQIASNSERKRQSNTGTHGPRPGTSSSGGYGTPQAVLQTPPGYMVQINGFNYIVPHGMTMIPSIPPQMSQSPMTPHGGYSSVPAAPRKVVRNVVKNRKKGPGPVSNGGATISPRDGIKSPKYVSTTPPCVALSYTPTANWADEADGGSDGSDGSDGNSDA
jgi:hypothetical protein